MKRAISILSAGLLWCAASAQASTVTIVTSFPKELTDAYKKAFERRHPDTSVEFLGKSGMAAMHFVRESQHGQRPDVIWASAPDAFEAMAREGLLEKAPEARNPAIPPRIGRYPMNDPGGLYYGQALSGYGIMWNKAYLQSHKLPVPVQWSDLASAAWFGHVAMSSPARSGTTHLTVETILQGEGWARGWSLLLQIAGNCVAITERSVDVPEGVAKGRFGAGLVIDFFGLAAKYSGAQVDFIYPDVTAVVPASIALIEGAKNSEAGRRFMAFALSRAGQELLLEPKISRIPAMQRGDFFDSVPGTYPNIFGVALRAKVTFNSKLAQERLDAVSPLFEHTITALLPELQAATNAIHAAAQKPALKQNAQAAALLARARALAYTPLVNEQRLQAQKPPSDVGKPFTPAAYVLPLPPQELQAAARERYVQARRLALEAAAQASR